jgi:hypothetical protein
MLNQRTNEARDQNESDESERDNAIELVARETRQSGSGLFALGQPSSLLARRPARRVRVARLDSAALGRRDKSGAVDARGLFGRGQFSGLLAGRQASTYFICVK